ncbi:T9SS type A sorting domain-containing protein [Paracnuella aquatica]|uniref:T9SS type A sorting domain-containing protein n=1 Tax=Paracnuella aquatica TaxID=2268757 RepID=UPI00138FAA2E|nr:T9SS type A sorting domain-containing protein [Paracnuella aquatica]
MNWDQRDYYYISSSRSAPYGHNSNGPTGGYINDLQETVQRFAIGRTGLTFTTSAVGMVKGENTSHTGDQAGFGGADAQFTPSANNQTITLNFDKEVSNVAFVLYDIDGGQRINFAARNAANTLVAVSLTPNNGTNTPVSGNGGTAAYVTSISTNAASNTNNATVRVNINGPVKQIVLTIPTIGSDPSFWLSRVNACVPDGNFPMNYYQVPELEPIAGQLPYFLVTPDNQSAYMMDTLGRAWHLFTDAQYSTNGYINSFAYDHKHRLLYYIAERSGSDSTVKTLKRYNFNTDVIQTIGDVETLMGIPTFEQGIQSGAAAFYDGALYLGVEGGYHTNFSTNPDTYTSRESIVYRIDIPDTAVSSFAGYRGYQVWAMPAYVGTTNTAAHDWGDFLIKDGVLIDFNTARTGTTTSTYRYANSAFHHINLLTGDTVQYTNPAGTTVGAVYSGQAGLDYYGNLWAVRNNLIRYDGNGKLGQAKTITVLSGPAWVGSAGDASEPFRPKMDFGDAPFVYEGSNRNQAAHEVKANLRIGSTLDLEWVKEPSANAYVNADADGGDEDGLRYVTLLTTSTNYLTEVDVFNNTGTVATIVAWLDFNKNNVFDPSEGIVQDVPSSASMQRLSLFWQGLSNTLQDGAVTYLRIRITSKSNNMGVNNATGYFPDGEVEDYLVTVDKTVLSSAAAKLSLEREERQSVRLHWTINGIKSWYRFVVERSSDRKNWSNIGVVTANEALAATSKQYSFTDGQPGTGRVTYRLLMQDVSGKYEYSEIKGIDLTDIDGAIHLTPNPAKDEAVLSLKYHQATGAVVTIHQLNGSVISKQQVALNKGWNRIALDGIAGLKPGMYMVKLQTSTEIKQMKLIKQ